MRFYNQQHQFYCGIDLHARLLAVCILDQQGAVVCQTTIPADKQRLLDTLAPFRTDVVVCVECLFAWYWVADLCSGSFGGRRLLLLTSAQATDFIRARQTEGKKRARVLRRTD